MRVPAATRCSCEELFAARTATITEAVLARIARFDSAMLATLAVAGGRASLALLERLSTSPDALREALDAGLLVRDDGDGVAFRHGLHRRDRLRALDAGGARGAAPPGRR